MQDGQQGDDIHRSVQVTPARSAHPAHSRIERRQRQGNQEHEGQQSDQDKGALGNIAEDVLPLPALVEPDVGNKMHQRIKKHE